jgi:hypothetical protein
MLALALAAERAAWAFYALSLPRTGPLSTGFWVTNGVGVLILTGAVLASVLLCRNELLAAFGAAIIHTVGMAFVVYVLLGLPLSTAGVFSGALFFVGALAAGLAYLRPFWLALVLAPFAGSLALEAMWKFVASLLPWPLGHGSGRVGEVLQSVWQIAPYAFLASALFAATILIGLRLSRVESAGTTASARG